MKSSNFLIPCIRVIFWALKYSCGHSVNLTVVKITVRVKFASPSSLGVNQNKK